MALRVMIAGFQNLVPLTATVMVLLRAPSRRTIVHATVTMVGEVTIAKWKFHAA